MGSGASLTWPFRGSEGVDLLDAEETTWAFASSSCVGCSTNTPVRTLDVVVGSSCGKLCCGLTADWSRRAFRGPLRCDYGILTRMPPNAAHYAEDDVGEGKSVDVYPRCSGYCAIPARRIAAAIWRMLASGDTMSA